MKSAFRAITDSFGGHWQLDPMFESLRYRWSSNEVKGISLAVVILIALASFALWRTLSSGAMARGIVVSTGAVSVARGCGANQQVASVQLSDGRIVYASADVGGPLPLGAHVTLQKQRSTCDAVTYEVVALQ